MDTKKLRQKILDLAIRGKLVPQDPNDEPTSGLLERIRAEKERLIAEGKIKRPKKSKSSSSESHYQKFDPPFPIPDNWEWVRLGEICDVARGGSPRPIKSFLTTQANGINWIKIGDTDKDGKYINSTKDRIIPSGVSKSRLVHKGDFLLTNSMSFGRPYILNIDGCIHDGWLVISPIGNVFDKNFLYLLLSSEYAFNQFRDQASGSAVSNLNSDKVADSLFPLPPIKTQEKIVEEYEKLSILVQELDTSKDNLKSVLQLAKSKILDHAMHGKLVPQDLTDEPAADMLRRINPKAKIITDNPHSWNIPHNWCLTRVKDVFNPMEKALPSGREFLYIDINSVDSKSNTAYPKKVKTECAPSRASRKTQRGDTVFSMVRPYLRKIAFVPINGCIASTGFYVLNASPVIYQPFAFRLALSDFFVNGLNSYMKGDNSPSINKTNVEDFVIPLPPVKEQIRIISKIEELYSLIDSIKASL